MVLGINLILLGSREIISRSVRPLQETRENNMPTSGEGCPTKERTQGETFALHYLLGDMCLAEIVYMGSRAIFSSDCEAMILCNIKLQFKTTPSSMCTSDGIPKVIGNLNVFVFYRNSI